MTDWLLISCIVSFLVACGLGLILFVTWRADRRAILKRLEPLHEPEGVRCPWARDLKFPHRLSGVAKAASPSTRTDGGRGTGTKHIQVSSRLLSGGSEGRI